MGRFAPRYLSRIDRIRLLPQSPLTYFACIDAGFDSPVSAVVKSPRPSRPKRRQAPGRPGCRFHKLGAVFLPSLSVCSDKSSWRATRFARSERVARQASGRRYAAKTASRWPSPPNHVACMPIAKEQREAKAPMSIYGMRGTSRSKSGWRSEPTANGTANRKRIEPYPAFRFELAIGSYPELWQGLPTFPPV